MVACHVDHHGIGAIVDLEVSRLPEPANPVILRRQLATLLREARVGADLTIEQVAEHLLCSTAKISRMETAARGVSLRDVRDLCALYSLDDEQRSQLMVLAKESRELAWWERHKLAPVYSTYVGLETAASAIQDFKSSIVPGFLQTHDYARAVIESYFSPADPLVVNQLTRTRMDRQAGLFGRANPTTLHVVMDEAVLHREVGGRQTMAEQLDRLVEDSDIADLNVQIVPFRAGAHAGVETTFCILSFADPSVPTAAFSEDVFGIMQLNLPDDLAKCQRIFEQVTDTALPPDESIELIKDIRVRNFGPVA
jgi:hypothetical protein